MPTIHTPVDSARGRDTWTSRMGPPAGTFPLQHHNVNLHMLIRYLAPSNSNPQLSPTPNRGPRKPQPLSHTSLDPNSRPYRPHSATARPFKQLKRIPPKAAFRILSSPPALSTTTDSAAAPPADIRACHVCHSAPKQIGRASCRERVF